MLWYKAHFESEAGTKKQYQNTFLLKSGALPTVSKTLAFEPCQHILRNILYVRIIEPLTDDI